MADDELNTRGLDKLLKALKGKQSTVVVGILGKNAAREGYKSNAEIGAVHEFGGGNVPQRSFLRIPIADNLGKQLEASGAFDKDTLQEVVAKGTLEPWLKKVGVIAEAIVAEGFASNGYGKWAPHSPGYNNKAGQILVDSGQLRDSITSEVR